MQFLKTLFWVVLAVVAVIFGYRNWIPVTIALWGGLEADVKLPMLLLCAFLIGFLPMFILHKATRWQLRRKLEGARRALDEIRSHIAEPADASPNASSPGPGEAAPHSTLL